MDEPVSTLDEPAAAHPVGRPDGRAAGRSRSWWAGVGEQAGRTLRWEAKGIFQLAFPAVFLVYMIQPIAGAFSHSHGIWAYLGLALSLAFCVCYLAAVRDGISDQHHRFWYFYAAMVVLFVASLPIDRADALPMLTYLAVLTVAARFLRAIPWVAGMALVAFALPALVPGWHEGVQPGTALSVVIVGLAMVAFFGVMRTNEALEDARAEVARLAAEGERTRIARDLHDLLGHSLTTITVKSALAHRLAERDPARAAVEIAEVEELARRTLTDVRAAVAGYREVTLANELAAAREVLRAAGISAVIPGAVDSVSQECGQLFAWVVREAVTNVVRHSRARRCEIRISAGSVEILDDGIGGSAVTPRQGNGLIGLAERVQDAGALLQVGARPDQAGWRVLVVSGDHA